MAYALHTLAPGMARTYLVFGDIEGKLDVLCVECTKCDRRGLHLVCKLIERHGRKGNLLVWRDMLNADCPSGTLPGFITAAIWCAPICRRW